MGSEKVITLRRVKEAGSEREMALWRIKGRVECCGHPADQFQAWVVSDFGDEAEKLAAEVILADVDTITKNSGRVTSASHSFLAISATVSEPTLIGYELRENGTSWFSEDVDPYK